MPMDIHEKGRWPGTGSMGSLALDSDTAHFIEGQIDYIDWPEHPLARELAHYWIAKCGDRAMPFRAEIRPSEIRALLPYLLINQVLEDGADFLIRLFGTELTKIAGEERTGKRVSEIAGTPQTHAIRRRTQERWMEINRRVYETAAPVYARVVMLNEQNASRDAHIVALPLTVTGDGVEQIMGGIFSAPAREPGRT